MSLNVHHLNGNLLVGSSHFYVDTLTNKVGITTTNPDAGLHVNSNAYVNTDFRVGADIAMNVASGRITAGSFDGDGSLLSGINSDSGSWVKDDANSKIYVSNTSHKVGIGTTVPDATLDVNGSITGRIVPKTRTITHGVSMSGEVDTFTLQANEQYIILNNAQGSADQTRTYFANFNSGVPTDIGTIMYLEINSSRTNIDSVGKGHQSEIQFNGTSVLSTGYVYLDPGETYNKTLKRVIIRTSNGWEDLTDIKHGDDGRLGIGTSTPVHKLHIYDDSTDPVYLKIQGETSNRAGIILAEDSNDICIMEYDGTGADAGNYLAFYSGYSNWAAKGTGLNFIPYNGRVGINTTSPESALHVNGSITVGDIGAWSGQTYTDAQLILGGTHNAGYNRGDYVKLLITGANNDGNSPYEILCEDENGFETFFLKGPVSHGGSDGILYMGGRVGIRDTTPSYALDVNGTIRGNNVSASDDRIKYNEADISNALSLILQLKPQKYEKIMVRPDPATGTWIPTDEEWENVKDEYEHGLEFGFVAQDVRKIPELAFLVEGEETRLGTQTPLALNYQGLFVLAIGAIKELKAMIETLETHTHPDLEERLANHTHPLEPHTHPELEERLANHTHPDLEERIANHTHPLEPHTHPLEPHTHPLEPHTHSDLVEQLAIEKAKNHDLQKRVTLLEHSHTALVARLEALEISK